MIEATRYTSLVAAGALMLGGVQVRGQSQDTTGSSSPSSTTSQSSTSSQDQSLGSSTDPSSSKANHETTAFLKEAARGNDAEVAMAEIAASRAQNPELKSFAQQIQKDHLQANQQLRTIAQKYGISVEQPMKRHEDRELSKLQKASGAEFDKEFATQMLKDHQKNIQRYEKASQKELPTDVKGYVNATLPKLREHLQHAQQIARSVGVSDTIISAAGAEESVGGSSATFENGSSSSSDASSHPPKQGSGAKELHKQDSSNTQP